MQTDDWFFSDEVCAARQAMRDAIEHFDQIKPSGPGHPESLAAARQAMKAESAYFHLVPSHRYGGEPADSWDVAEGEAARIEGFTPGESG